MNFGKFFAWGMVLMSFAASVGYLVAQDYRRSAYWFFAACLTISVTV